MKKACFIIPSYAGGGAERATITIASELQKEDGLSVTLIVLNADGPLRDLPQGVEVVEFENKRSAYAFFDLRSFLQESGPDIVFSVLPQANILMYLVNKTVKAGWQTVCMLQNFYERLISQNNFLIGWLFTRSLKSADKVISCSQGLSKNITEKIAVKSENSYHIYNPIDIDEIEEKAKKGVHADIFKKSKKQKILGVGRLTKQKGFSYLIEATKRVNDSGINADLILLGEGKLENELKSLATELGIKDKVHFFGFVDNPYKYMKAADVFVLSSLWEGFGLVLVEALACRTPIVATDCPFGPSEILKNGKFGKLVPPKSSEKLANEITKSLKADKHENAYLVKRASDFAPRKISQMYKTVIQKLAN